MQNITPCLWFDHNAEEAVAFYLSIFPGSRIISTMHYPKSQEEGLADFQEDLAGKVLTISFELLGQEYVALNAGPEFKFNESISMMIGCKDQAEIDYYWDALTKDGGEENVCGWLKDKFGLSWQVCPANWEAIIKGPGAFKAMMDMTKLIIADFERAASQG